MSTRYTEENRCIRWKMQLPVDGGNLRVEREWSRMLLVLIPGSPAIRRSLNAEQNAEDEYEKPREQGQESEDDDRSLIVLLAFGEWIH